MTGWGLYDTREEDASLHVCPMFGRRHDLSLDCWCHPQLDASADTCECECECETQVVVHNQEH